MTDKKDKELPGIYIVLDERFYPCIFEQKWFEMYFDVDKGRNATINKKKHQCGDCQCHRFCSFVEKSALNEARGEYWCGKYNHRLLGIYWLKGGWKVYEPLVADE
jgi:hypothetical protein